MPDKPHYVTTGDCVEVMAAMPAASADAIVTDPPYGLEFMGKDWDRLDADLPQENVWKGRRGAGGSSIGTDDSKPGSRHHVALGAGKQHGFERCRSCGKRKFSGSPCECEAPDFVLEYRQEAPSSSIRMQRWHEAWAREAYRVLKPGGRLLAFGGTRTHHRLTSGIEDAGFEIGDTIAWLYGSGFPKSLDVGAALDRLRQELGRLWIAAPYGSDLADAAARRMEADMPQLDAITDERAGFGTALKPGHEPVVVARKPLAGTVARNVQAHGTGALNIDECRIGSEPRAVMVRTETVVSATAMAGESTGATSNGEMTSRGRWPANVVLSHTDGCVQTGTRRVRADGHHPARRPQGSKVAGPSGHAGQDALAERFADGEMVEAWECRPDCPVRLLDEHSGTLTSGQLAPHHRRHGARLGVSSYGHDPGIAESASAGGTFGGDRGGASRFFYVAKADTAERNAGLGDDLSLFSPAGGAPARNDHPTVKPIALMRWLCRLVTPPGGVVLDPFAGSGTTGCAAALEGFQFVGIERDPEYAAIARARLAHWSLTQEQTA